jgi:DHA2 family multidrug resistance protein
MPDVARTLDLATDTGRALLDGIITHQAEMIAYANDFWLLTILTLCALPLVLIIGKMPRKKKPADEEAAVFD